ncbi:nitrate/sulfonate/bicarbonate ABC transporter ATP-binding protein [soil metagenome]
MPAALKPAPAKPARRNHEPLLDIAGVRQAFRGGGASDLLVLDGVDLKVDADEIVGLLGRSGSGKSPLLRIISGLVRPTGGEVKWRGRPITGPSGSVSMVFQSFALFPWLTVQGNVELGLEALGLSAAERRSRALSAIDLIGLDGFENAYPKELSGGMRQRVGFARALVVHPELLLMDEPFSALDVLTAETLRTDLVELWSEGKLPIRSILLVTHSIEEAVLMCDRVVLFASNPARVAAEIAIDLPHPRARTDKTFMALVDDIYGRMTNQALATRHAARSSEPAPGGGVGVKLPPVSPNELAGLLEAITAEPFSGKADLPDLADELTMEVDDLFPLAETLQLLRMAEVAHGDIRLTDVGRRFVDGDVDQRKKLFAEQLLAHVPLVAQIRRVLDERTTHRAGYTRFSEELEDYMSEDFAEETLRAAIQWGRYAELFAYDEQSQAFSLEDPA